MTNPAPPTDAELFPARDVEIIFTVRSDRGQDPDILAEYIREQILLSLARDGQHELLKVLRNG